MELIHIQQTTIGNGAVNSVNARELHAKLDERVPLFLALIDELEQALITGDMPDKFKV